MDILNAVLGEVNILNAVLGEVDILNAVFGEVNIKNRDWPGDVVAAHTPCPYTWVLFVDPPRLRRRVKRNIVQRTFNPIPKGRLIARSRRGG